MDFCKQFYELYQFLGGYFHQGLTYVYDWQGQRPTFEPIVHFYKAKNPPAVVAKATSELERFLALPLDDETLEDVVNQEFGSSYYPAARGLTERQWLEQVLKILKEPVSPATPILQMAKRPAA